MISAFATLVGFALLGDVASRELHLPIPGPVTGLAALAFWLWVRSRALRTRPMLGTTKLSAVPADLATLSATLIANLGVMFVPAGAGVVDQLDHIGAQWLPIVAALIGSTLMSLWVTGAVMHLCVGRGRVAT